MFNFTFVRASLLAVILTSMTFVSATPQPPPNQHRPQQDPAETITASDEPVNTIDSLASTSTYYTIRRDARRCPSPLCRGYSIKRVNTALTPCGSGRQMAECYVAKVDWNGQPEVELNKALLRGSVVWKENRDGKYAALRVTESWNAASDRPPTGAFYRLRDLGVRCIAAPCPTHHAAKLNTTSGGNVAGVDLTGVAAQEDFPSKAFAGMTEPDGILVAGSNVPVTGPAGRAVQLKATQFYALTKQTSTQKPCKKTGCSSQVCSDEEVMTTCEYRKEYDCYKKARCERQQNGNCGFTPTPELTSCLRQK